MSFVVLQIVTSNKELSEILQAELSNFAFDVFLETEQGFETSIETQNLDKVAVVEVLESYRNFGTYSYTFEEVEKQNWNTIWEQNFEPIVIANQCLVRAEFHQIAEKYPYELVITPKMSFGTGHHATTTLMLEHLLENDMQHKTIADCGSGTGILAIMAMKLGAKSAIACDIEDWAVENTVENATDNGVIVSAIQGTAKNLLTAIPFEVVIANIQLNVLVEEMPIYEKMLAKNGLLFLSGILAENKEILLAKAQEHQFRLLKTKEKNNWLALSFIKN
jgi:ribosomal protein L11 methyltransferase